MAPAKTPLTSAERIIGGTAASATEGIVRGPAATATEGVIIGSPATATTEGVIVGSPATAAERVVIGGTRTGEGIVDGTATGKGVGPAGFERIDIGSLIGGHVIETLLLHFGRGFVFRTLARDMDQWPLLVHVVQALDDAVFRAQVEPIGAPVDEFEIEPLGPGWSQSDRQSRDR